jgi:two-component system response regulator
MECELPMEANRAVDVLVVEDDPADAELTLNALSKCGINLQVEHVNDGQEALDYITSTSLFIERHTSSAPRLILLDLKLRELSGLHVIRQLKSNERTRSIPIVALTSSRLAIELVESYRLGVNSYVIKPTEAKKFVEVIGSIARYWLAVNEPPPPH